MQKIKIFKYLSIYYCFGEMKHTNKLPIILFLLFAIPAEVNAQAKIGDNKTIVQPGSILELESTNKGFLNVRLNTAQMLSIPVSATSRGMMVYNTDSSCLCLFNGLGWQNLCRQNNLHQVKMLYTANAGDSVFICPENVYNPDDVQIFRNGIQINFSATIGTKFIKLESAAFCKQDDEIKIIQLTND